MNAERMLQARAHYTDRLGFAVVPIQPDRKKPLEGLTALTVLLGIALALSGIVKILFARALTGVPGVGMVVFSGLASIVLAVLILAKLPVASEVAVGVLIGIDFISSGSSLTWVAVQAKRITSAVATAA